MTDNLPPLPQTDWLLHMPAQGLPDGWVPVPVELLKRAESSLGSFCSDHGWGGADMDTMDAISSALAASPAQPVQPSETDNGISSEDWIEAAMRVYLIAGDTEQEAQECAEYQWGEMDMDDLCDPYEAAMADVEGRGPALQPQPVQPSDPWLPIETAPKDGTRVLLRGNDDRHADGYWQERDVYTGPAYWVWPYVKCEPTHWMPLPPAPQPKD